MDTCLLCGSTREDRKLYRDPELFWGACQTCASGIIREELKRRVPEAMAARQAQELESVERTVRAALSKRFY